MTPKRGLLLQGGDEAFDLDVNLAELYVARLGPPASCRELLHATEGPSGVEDVSYIEGGLRELQSVFFEEALYGEGRREPIHRRAHDDQPIVGGIEARLGHALLADLADVATHPLRDVLGDCLRFPRLGEVEDQAFFAHDLSEQFPVSFSNISNLSAKGVKRWSEEYDAMRMPAFKGWMPDKSLEYLEGVEEEYTCREPRAIAARVKAITEEHDDWRRNKCLNLNPSENAISPRARKLLDTDLATRVTEGFIGDKEYPPAPMNRYIDEIEGIIIHLVKRMFRCEYVEWRTLSSSMANSLVYFALSKSGDTIMSQSDRGGGNDSYRPNGPPLLRGLKVSDLPDAPLFDIDYDTLDVSIKKGGAELDSSRRRADTLPLRFEAAARGGGQGWRAYPIRRCPRRSAHCLRPFPGTARGRR